MRTSVNYFVIGLIILVLGLLLITAGHWSDVSLMFNAVRNGLSTELGPAILMVFGIAYMISRCF